MAADTCATCKFWLKTDNGDEQEWGLCRCHPPQVVITPKGRRATVFPTTTWDLGCGDHKPRQGNP